MYNDWAGNTIEKFKEILNSARRGHADSVRTRIEDVKPLSNVVEITKQLFEVSKVCMSILPNPESISQEPGKTLVDMY